MYINAKMLKELCEEQIKKGNGDKNILISRDDEGNGFHGLFYGFEDEVETIKSFQEITYFEENPEEILLLG